MAMVESALAQLPQGRRGNSLADVIDLILDKGLVIDAFVRVSVIGIEVLTIDARIVVASVDTYLRFAEAVNRLDLTQTKEATTYRDLVEGTSREKSKGALEGAKEAITGGGGDGKEGGQRQSEEQPSRRERGEGEREDEGVMARLSKRGRWSE
jgi:gas vesicle structural protein